MIRLRGRVTDTKPAGLYVDGDSETLDVHDMVVDLVVGYPELTIREVTVVMDKHPTRPDRRSNRAINTCWERRSLEISPAD